MLDYRPIVNESKIKLNKNIDDIKFVKNENEKSKLILDRFYKNLERNSTSNAIAKVNNLKYIELKTNNDSITDVEKGNFNDILNYESQNDRISSVVEEVKKIEETLSMMMYGEIVSPESAKEKDYELFKYLKETDKANNLNLINISKMLIIINEHINSIEKHIEGISYINEEISDFSKLEKTLVLSDEEVSSIQLDSKILLEESLSTVNYISDKSSVNNHMIKLYNSIVDYNLCDKAINKLNSVNNIDKTSMYSNRENSIKKNFVELIKTIEYSTAQSDRYLDNLRLRFEMVKVLYNYK